MKGRAWMLLLAPALALFLLMQAGPLVLGIGFSFYKVTWQETRFVGWDNFSRLLADPALWQALRNTGLYVAIIVPAVEGIGLLVAVAAHGLSERAKGWVRSIIYLVNRVSGVAMLGAWLYIWSWNGALNKLLGIQVHWYAQPLTAFVLVCATGIVWNWGNRLLIYMSGMDAQPKDVHEAAILDGAGGWRRFWSITFPLLRRLILYQMVLSVIGIAQLWEIVFLFSKGGPDGSTASLGYYLFQTAYARGDYGLASAVGMIELVLIGSLAAVQVRMWRER